MAGEEVQTQIHSAETGTQNGVAWEQKDTENVPSTRAQRFRQYQRQISSRITQGISNQFPSQSPLPIWLLAFIFIIIGIVFMFALIAIFSFPNGMKKEDTMFNPTKFIAENAYDHIRYLSVDIGYRVIGTVQNEELTVNYLLGQIVDIISRKSPEIDIEIDHDTVDGFVNREARYHKTAVVFRGFQNIAVKLSPKNVDPNLKYILLNSHFDTVPLSPGAGDDGTMVGVMLELLRVFSKLPYFKHPIVFLFNGGEEVGLLASRGYIEQNAWANKTGVLLNLEVTGGGGKELVFQARSEHPWLMETYRDSAPYPFATTVAQEIYEGGLIQSDTDYSNFKTMYDRLPAMDFAHAYDCYTYHTRLDDISTITLGSLQHTGDNMVELIKKLDTRTEIDNYLDAADDGGDNVFYDYLGLFLIFYSNFAGTILNSLIFVVLTIITGWCAYQIKKHEGLNLGRVVLEYVIALFIQLLAIIVAFGVLLFIAWFMDVCNRSMSWYTSAWLLFGIYYIPFFAVSGLIPYLYIKFREKKQMDISTSYYVQMALHAHCNWLSIVLVILTIFGLKSAYMALLSTMFYFFTTFLNVLFNLVNKGNRWLYLHCIGQIFPSLYYFYIMIQMLQSMIPIGARAYDGALRNPEITISLIVALFTLLSTGFYAPIFVMFTHRKKMLAVLGAIFVTFIIMAFTPLGFPYKERQPQRFVVWHTKREFFDYAGKLRHEDAGYYVHGSDRHGPRTLFDDVPRLHDGHTANDDCDKYLMCGQPWWRVNYDRNRDYNYFIPAEQPLLPNPLPKLVLKSRAVLSPTRTRYEFSFAGPHFMNVQISPMFGVKLVQWSFADEIIAPNQWKDRDYYFINYYHGVRAFLMAYYDFSLVMERPQPWTEPYSFDIALSASWIHDESTKTKQFKEFTDAFPVWTNCQNWTSYHVGYQY